MKRRLSFALLSTLLLPAGSTLVHAQTADLITLYNQAVNYDADIAAARSAYFAEKYNEDIATASLLPIVEGSASYGHTDSDPEVTKEDTWDTTQYKVTLTQPLIDLPSWNRLSSAELRVLQSETTYLSAQQQLILDVASAYFNVLREEENLKTAIAQEAAVKRQYEQAREQFDVGLIAITDVHEAKATYDSSQTARIVSEGNLTLAIEDLNRLTGQQVSDLYTLKDDVPIKMDESLTADNWVDAAYENNLSIKAAEFNLKALQEDYEAKETEHYPTLNLQASYENTDLNNFYPLDQETEETSVFLTLSVPIYTGGSTSAQVKQLREQVEQARYELSSTKRKARLESRTEFINLTTNVQTVESLKQNIISRESALEATREGYNVGTRNIVEVLDAERLYFSALRDHANARFDFVEGNLRIRRAAGTLSVQDIEKLNALLDDTP